MTKRRVVLLAKNIHRVTDQQNAVTAMNNWKFRGEIEIRASLFLTLIRQKRIQNLITQYDVHEIMMISNPGISHDNTRT